MLQPIQKEDEMICPGCGCVLAQINESHNSNPVKPVVPFNVNIALLGSACDKNIKYSFPRSRQQVQEEEVLKLLEHMVNKFSLPERFVMETFNIMKKRNRGFWSQKEPINQLIKILTKDDNFYYIRQLKKLKAYYEKISNC